MGRTIQGRVNSTVRASARDAHPPASQSSGVGSGASVAATTPPARPLGDLVAGLDPREIRGDAGVDVADVVDRSDRVSRGSLFFCVPGERVDGHDFSVDAVRRGAAALVVERWLDLDVAQILVPSVRAAMGPVAAAFFGAPSERIAIAGVTGTNGKTTVTYLLESIFRAAGLVPGVIGTTGARVAGTPVPFERTTPEASSLQRLLWEMAERDVDAVAMEVSSHGLEQHRVDGTRFAVAAFTNLSQDHLDYHGTMQEYFAAKARLFTAGFTRRAVINVDDAFGRRLIQTNLRTTTFGTSSDAEFRAVDVQSDLEGVRFSVDGLAIRSPLRGSFNASNALAAFACARAMDIEDEAIVTGIATMPGVPGRVESVDVGQGFLVLVDYAHTPVGLENVLRAARGLASGRVFVVIGSGGDRDRAKRPSMGRAATSIADLSIFTSDNPRSEEPLGILEDMRPGAIDGGGDYEVEPDRATAIRLAVSRARAGDVVVIAGKGHETGQEFADRTIPFDDREVAETALRELRGPA